ncbi:MAG: TIM barrel protein, partial [Collinsella sp.]
MDCRGSYDLVRENDFGTLEAGKLADICVLDRDVFAVDPKDARDIEVSLTLSDGRVVYEDCWRGDAQHGFKRFRARLRREQVAGMNIHYIMWSLDYFLDVQQRLGFKTIELWAAEPHVTLDHTGYFEADKLRRKIESRGLSGSSLCPENVVYPWQYAARKPLHAQRSLAYFKHGIELAEVLGAPYMSINSGWGDWDEDREEAWKRSAEHLAILADYAGEHGVTLC